MVNITKREALNIAISGELENDPEVFLIGEEVAQYNGAYKVSNGLLDKFGDKRVIDTPISEYGFAGIAVGAAFAGLKPIVEFMSFNFSMQAIDHIVNSAAKTLYMSGGKVSCPIVFRGPNGPAPRVAAQHTQCFASWYARIPGLIVLAPFFAEDYIGLFRSAVRNPNPVVFLESEEAYNSHQEIQESCLNNNYTIEIGKARVVESGSDITVISFSMAMEKTISAINTLKEEYGLSVELIDLRSLNPIDTETIFTSVKKTNRVVLVEGGWGDFGICSHVSHLIYKDCFDYLDSQIEVVAAENIPTPYAKNLENLMNISTDKIIEKCLSVCYINKK